MAPRPRKPKAESVPAESAAALQQERRRVAHLLHNTICQELTGICFLAGAAAHKHGRSEPEAGQRFQEIAELVQRAGARLAEIVHDLNGSAEE